MLPRYLDSEAAKTTFTVSRARTAKCGKRRHRHRCTRYVRVGSFSRNDTAGSNHFRFTGRVGGHALSAGNYRLAATPRASGVNGTGATAKFGVLKRK